MVAKDTLNVFTEHCMACKTIGQYMYDAVNELEYEARVNYIRLTDIFRLEFEVLIVDELPYDYQVVQEHSLYFKDTCKKCKARVLRVGGSQCYGLEFEHDN